jgi:hypothetical protein
VDHQVATISTMCLNCGAALDGPFCSHCGQRAVAPKPTLHELLHDALEEFLHFDGKVVQTLRTLVTRPGQLTVDIIAGRRARYIAPLRLYLTVSVLFFVVAALSPSGGLKVRRVEPGSSGISVGLKTGGEMTAEEKRQLLEAADTQGPRFLRPLVHRVIEDPVGLTNGVFAAWPKAMFVLLPVFALIVALFYRRRHFVEHMYFALHIHAFAFLAMTVTVAIGLAHIAWLSVALGGAVLVGIPVYVHLAFKRVYGDTHILTIVKETGVGFLYTLAAIPAIFIAALWAASHPH